MKKVDYLIYFILLCMILFLSYYYKISGLNPVENIKLIKSFIFNK